MSKKRGKTKMPNVPPNGLLVVCDITENIEPDFSGLAELGRKVAQERDNKVLDAILQEKKVERSVCQALREPGMPYPESLCKQILTDDLKASTHPWTDLASIPQPMECTLVKSELLDDENYLVTIRRQDGSEVRVMIPREDSSDTREREVIIYKPERKFNFGLNLVCEGHYT